MLNKFRIGAAGVALVSALGMTNAANAATTASATAQAYILEALSVVSDGSKLDFGDIAINGSGGIVRVDPDTGTVSACNGGLVCNGTPSAAGFDVAGEPDADFKVTITNSSITLTNGSCVAGPGVTCDMTADQFRGSSSLATWVGTLDGTGALHFDVGGRLTVVGTEGPGTYTGTLDLSVAYQ